MTRELWWSYEASEESTIAFPTILDRLFVELVLVALNERRNEALPKSLNQNIPQSQEIIFWPFGTPIELASHFGFDLKNEGTCSENIKVHFFIDMTANNGAFNTVLVFIELGFRGLFINFDIIFLVKSYFLGLKIIILNHLVFRLSNGL